MSTQYQHANRILFVDDEENVLKGIKVMLYTMRSSWEIEFAQGGREALAIMADAEPFQVIVTDMYMPGMHGDEFLKEAAALQPESVRIVLSGNLDVQTLTAASSLAHQVLAKPCDPHHLRNVLSRALSVNSRLANCSLRNALMGMGALPSVPVVYWEIMNEINAPEPSMELVGKIIEKDPGLSAKVLQIANAHTGPGRRISSIAQAAAFLGLENIKSFVLMAEMFSQAHQSDFAEGFSLGDLWQHALDVGQFAKTIAEIEEAAQSTRDDAYTAGLLHDIGLLIIASQLPEELNRALAYGAEKQCSLMQAEKDLFGATHAEIGGYLLDLWGLPEPVVEAIAWHYYPSSAPTRGYGADEENGLQALTAVHVANYFCEDQEEGGERTVNAEIDAVHLELIGMTDRLGIWWDVCRGALTA